VRVLIIGASGLIGSSLLTNLRDEGVHVVGTTSSRSQPQLQPLDLSDSVQLHHFLTSGGFDFIVNCASKGVIRGSATADEMHYVNVEIARRIAVGMSQLNAPCNLLHLSSSTEPLGSTAPESDYAKFKKEGTEEVRRILAGSAHALKIVRVHNVYATQLLPKRFISEVAIAAKKGDEFRLEFPNRVRDFVYLGDVISSLKEIILNDAGVARQYEVGTGVGRSLSAVAEMIYGMSGRSRSLIIGSSDSTKDEHSYEVAGNEGFDQKLGVVDLPEGLSRLIGAMS